MSPPWWAAVAPVTTLVRCGDEEHPLRWEDGAIHLDGHADPEAEGALSALGATLPTCLQLKACWDAHAGDVSLVTLGRRPGEADLGIDAGQALPLLRGLDQPTGPPRQALARTTLLERRRAEDRRRQEILFLTSLPVTFIDRLVLTAFAQAAGHWEDDDFRLVHGLRLGAALCARSTPALRRFGAEVADGQTVVVHCAPTSPRQRASVRAERLGRALHVTAQLPLEWVSEVWGPGISEPGGRFVLRLTDASGDELGVDLAVWEPAGPASWVAVSQPGRLKRDADGLLQPVL